MPRTIVGTLFTYPFTTNAMNNSRQPVIYQTPSINNTRTELKNQTLEINNLILTILESQSQEPNIRDA